MPSRVLPLRRRYGFYRSDDSSITPDDEQTGNAQQVNSVPDSRSMTVTPTTTYYYGACVDAVSNETNTSNNCSDGILVIVQDAQTQQSDLVAWTNISGTMALPLGDSFTMDGVVFAMSGPPVATTLRFYRSTDSSITPDDMQIGSQSVSIRDWNFGTLEAIKTITYTPDLDGFYYYGACVDAVSNESNTSNNCSHSFGVIVYKLDLEVTASVNKTEVPAGQSFTLSASVNEIEGDESKSTLRYYISTGSFDNKREFDTDEVDIPSNNLQKTISPNNDAYPPDDQAYYVVCVDALSNESNTDNNCASTEWVTVQRPDIQTDISVISENVVTRENFNLRVNVSNIGTLIADDVTLYGYINGDRVSMPFLGNSLNIGSVSVGDLWEGDITLKEDTKGTFTYKVCAEKVNYEKETNNNCDEQKITVNKSIRPPTASRGNSIQGNEVEWSSVSGATYYEVYHSGDADWTSDEEATPEVSRDAPDTDWVDNVHSRGDDYYKVKACNSKECSDFSNEVIFDIEAPALKINDSYELELSWSSAGVDVTYEIWRDTCASSCDSHKKIAETKDQKWDVDNDPLYNDPFVNNNPLHRIFSYRIKACSDGACSDLSNKAEIKRG